MRSNSKKNRNPAANSGVKVLSRRELEKRADLEARAILGVDSREKAFAMLDRGELRGTAAEAEFEGLRFLLDQ